MDAIKKNPIPWIVGGLVALAGAWFLYTRKELFTRKEAAPLRAARNFYKRFPRTPSQAIMGTVRLASDLSTKSLSTIDKTINVLPKPVGDLVGRDFSATKGRRGGLFGTLAGWNGGIIGTVTSPWRN